MMPRALLAQAVEAKVASLLDSHADEVTDDGRRRLVRHGDMPERAPQADKKASVAQATIGQKRKRPSAPKTEALKGYPFQPRVAALHPAVPYGTFIPLTHAETAI
jgi:hypothetical protein